MLNAEWFKLLACSGHLALAMVSLFAGKGGPLRVPLTLLCLDLFFWSFADWAYDFTGDALWDWLDASGSPLAAPLTLHLVLSFVGELRARRRWLTVAYCSFGALALFGLLGALGLPLLDHFRWEDWARVMLSMSIPVVVALIVILLQHLRRHSDREERTRTFLMLSALTIGAGFGLSDVAGELAPAIPNLTPLGTLCAALMLLLVLLRYRLVGSSPTMAMIGYLGIVASVAVLLAAMAVVVLSTRAAVLLLAFSTITLASSVAVHEVITLYQRRKHRERELAFLGRMSAQMAHDVKTPLAALKGAAQCLLAELENTPRTARGDRMLELIAEQVDRVAKVIDRYGRLSRIEATLTLADVAETVAGVMRTFTLHGPAPTFVTTFGEAPIVARIDVDLMALALQNLVTNSVEAVGAASDGRVSIEVKAAPRRGASTEPGVSVTVADNGPGMDARSIEHAWDEFYTTKSSGSGLGLAFVRRVVDAHGGTAVLKSVLGQGTTVCIWLPRQFADESPAFKNSRS